MEQGTENQVGTRDDPPPRRTTRRRQVRRLVGDCVLLCAFGALLILSLVPSGRLTDALCGPLILLLSLALLVLVVIGIVVALTRRHPSSAYIVPTAIVVVSLCILYTLPFIRPPSLATGGGFNPLLLMFVGSMFAGSSLPPLLGAHLLLREARGGCVSLGWVYLLISLAVFPGRTALLMSIHSDAITPAPSHLWEAIPSIVPALLGAIAYIVYVRRGVGAIQHPSVSEASEADANAAEARSRASRAAAFDIAMMLILAASTVTFSIASYLDSGIPKWAFGLYLIWIFAISAVVLAQLPGAVPAKPRGWLHVSVGFLLVILWLSWCEWLSIAREPWRLEHPWFEVSSAIARLLLPGALALHLLLREVSLGRPRRGWVWFAPQIVVNNPFVFLPAGVGIAASSFLGTAGLNGVAWAIKFIVPTIAYIVFVVERIRARAPKAVDSGPSVVI